MDPNLRKRVKSKLNIVIEKRIRDYRSKIKELEEETKKYLRDVELEPSLKKVSFFAEYPTRIVVEYQVKKSVVGYKYNGKWQGLIYKKFLGHNINMIQGKIASEPYSIKVVEAQDLVQPEENPTSLIITTLITYLENYKDSLESLNRSVNVYTTLKDYKSLIVFIKSDYFSIYKDYNKLKFLEGSLEMLESLLKYNLEDLSAKIDWISKFLIKLNLIQICK